jgi:hypothetical protein
MTDNTDLIARLLEIADAYDTSLENDIWCEDELREAAAALAARDALFADDRHLIQFRDGGWTIAHPISERLDGSLFDCPARWDDDDPGLRGRYEFKLEAEYDNWVVGDEVAE